MTEKINIHNDELNRKLLILQEEVKKLRNRNQLARALLDEGVI